MGNWTVVIEGSGPHEPSDLDDKVKSFLEELKSSGQYINHASVTADYRRDLI